MTGDLCNFQKAVDFHRDIFPCRKISRNDLSEYIGKHYSAPRMVLAAAGGN